VREKKLRCRKTRRRRAGKGKRRLGKIAAHAGLGYLQKAHGDPPHHEYFPSLPAAHPLAPLQEAGPVIG
jgi:hypothetical protein